MGNSLGRLLLLVSTLFVCATPAFGQGGVSGSTLSGVVVDSQGGVLPGATIAVKNNATSTEFRTVSDGKGEFVVPGLAPGDYTLSVSLSGFKTFVSPDVKMVAATPLTVKAALALGQVEENVVVVGATDVVQTQSATIQTTLEATQLQQLPLSTHTALDYIISLPGINTSASGNTRGSTINGLPNRAMNITMDGINVQDNRSNTEGFFMYIRPMMDSVEEITVSTSTPGAESTGSGAAQIRMTTRSGSNVLTGAAYNSWRNQAGTTDADTLTRTKKAPWYWRMNTPYWFNKRDKPKTAAGDYFIDDIRLQTPGFSAGGPAIKNTLFYFGNWEWFVWPNSASRIRYFLKPAAAQGVFSYKDNSGAVRSIDLMTLAASKGQTSTADPTLAKLFADIRAAASTEGGIDSTAELNLEKYSYSPTGNQFRYFPTGRLDYNITPAHRISGVFRWNHFGGQPDVLNNNESSFPGFPNRGGQGSERYFWQTTLRSTLGRTLVNELTVGGADATGYGTYFSVGVNSGMFNCSGLGCQSVGGKGYQLALNGGSTAAVASVNLTNPTVSTSPSADVAASLTIDDSLTWLKGRHTVSTGLTFSRIKWRGWSDNVVDGQINFGMDNRDPAFTMFDTTSGNFPGGIDTTQAGYARSLYSIVTGRVNAFSGNYLWNGSEYVFNGEDGDGVIYPSLGLFMSDSWRVKPNLTLTGGLRYELQFPIRDNWGYSAPQTWQMVYGATGAGSGSIGQGNLFKPGTLTGTNPVFVKYDNSKPAYKTDFNNLAPSLGVAWRPTLKGSILSGILGESPVIRGGYSMSFTKWATTLFTTPFSNNPGRNRTGNRGLTSGTPQIGFDGFPLLLRDTARLTPGTAPTPLAYPFAAASNETFRGMHPDQPVPLTHQYSVGLQREFGKDTAIEIRYVGNTNVGEIFNWDINGSANWSMLAGENGFYDEFRRAQANLHANVQAGNGTTFAYTGAPGTSPLPIFMAFFAGIPLNDARNQNPANYTSTNFRSSSWYNQLNYYNPNFTGIAGLGTSGLQNTSFEVNAAAAGLPRNFFRANPDIGSGGSSILYTQAGNRRFNAVQLEVRRRLRGGLLLGGSYQREFNVLNNNWRTLRENAYYRESTNAPVHAIKANWVYQLPFGRDRKYGSGASRMRDLLIGGWEWDGVLRTQSGDRFNFGAFRLVGVSEEEFKDLFKFYKVKDAAGLDRLYMFPQDFIEQSIVALTRLDPATTTGYTNNVLPTGRYLASASGTDCVQYANILCQGTRDTRIVEGPWYFRNDMSFVKRFNTGKRTRIEARMDIFNVFNTVNFVATTRGANPGGTPANMLSAWEVNAAATDLNAAQDPGGRITQYSLRFTW
jgi:Carboxypeptidase regulatory-like domain